MPQYLSQRQIHFLMGSIIISTNFKLHNHKQVNKEQYLKKKKKRVNKEHTLTLEHYFMELNKTYMY